MRNHPKKGDWASWAISLIEKYEINMTLEEIKETKESIFKNMVKKQMIKFAFKDLVNRQKKGEKGRNIIYEDLSMSDYLLPETPLAVTEKRHLFAVRTEMNLNPHNYGNKTYCEEGCNELQSNQHIFECSKQNKEESKLKYDDILNGSLQMKIKSLKKFQEKFNERKTTLGFSLTC